MNCTVTSNFDCYFQALSVEPGRPGGPAGPCTQVRLQKINKTTHEINADFYPKNNKRSEQVRMELGPGVLFLNWKSHGTAQAERLEGETLDADGYINLEGSYPSLPSADGGEALERLPVPTARR